MCEIIKNTDENNPLGAHGKLDKFHNEKIFDEFNNLLSRSDFSALNDSEKITHYIEYRIGAYCFAAALDSYLHPVKDSRFDELKKNENGLSINETRELRKNYFNAIKNNIKTIYDGMAANYAQIAPAHVTQQ